MGINCWCCWRTSCFGKLELELELLTFVLETTRLYIAQNKGSVGNANERVLYRRREHAQNEGSGSPSVDRTNEPKMLLFLLQATPQTNVKTAPLLFFILTCLPHTHTRERAELHFYTESTYTYHGNKVYLPFPGTKTIVPHPFIVSPDVHFFWSDRQEIMILLRRSHPPPRHLKFPYFPYQLSPW